VKALLRQGEGSSHVLQSVNTRPQLSYISFDVSPEGNYLGVNDRGHNFARLNKKSCDDLLPFRGEGVILRAFSDTEALANALKYLTSWNTKTVDFEINIYGQREIAGRVGKLLSKSGVFFQPPRFGVDDVEYYNPHFFRVDGFFESYAFVVLSSQESRSSSNNTPVTRVSGPEALETQASDAAQVDSILDSLSHHSDLRRIRIDRRIKTDLLPCATPLVHVFRDSDYSSLLGIKKKR
jgi:SWI/SNF-related matrix-associated actin-dependent regulator of chromatin subfamily A3